MKKSVMFFAAVLAVFALGGCQKSESVTNLILATGGVSGTYYPFGGAMGQIWNTSIDKMNVTAQATGASKENIRLVGSDEADLAIVQNDVMDYAMNGTVLFKPEEKVVGFRTVATLYPEVIQIVVAPGSGITSIADLRGRRVSVGDAGSGVEANAQQILAAYGITFADIKAAHLSFKESAAALKDKQLDAFFVTAGVPNAAIQELGALGGVNLIAIDDEHAKILMDLYKFYARVSIPAGTYNGQAAAIPTVAVKATLIARDDLSADVVYKLVKTLFEKQPELAQAHAKGAELSLASAQEGVSVEFHPGAKRYFDENRK